MNTPYRLPGLALALASLLFTTGCNDDAAAAPDTQGEAPVAAPADAPAAASAEAADERIAFDVAFVTHLDMDMPEQDVFIEREPGSGEIYRVTKGDNDMKAPLYKTRVAVKHDPFDPKAVGPYEKGEPMGFTLGDWLRHQGTGTYSYENGVGSLKLKFSGLVPNGVYTMWHAFIGMPPTQPFSGALDLPLGARDGSESVFVADEDGKAEFVHDFKPGLEMSDVQTAALLAIAYHSDGKTYGGVAGDFGRVTHVPLVSILPQRSGIK